VAGAVALDTGITGLRDSKKLSKRQREALAPQITAQALAVGLGWVWPAEIDTHGLTWAVRTAMARALEDAAVAYDELIIDGNINYFPADPRARAIIRADDTVPSVSAASILAKVARDNYMTALGEQYAGYGFAKHVGYGTKQHLEALRLLGVSDIHRRSYKPIQALLT
jgi:ribonuclease HII